MRNSVMLIGRPASDAVQIDDDGTMYCRLIVVEKTYENGEEVEERSEFDCIFKGRLAERAAYIRRGKRIAVEGRIRQTATSYEVVVNDLFIVDHERYDE